MNQSPKELSNNTNSKTISSRAIRVAIVGGGTGGLSVLNSLRRKLKNAQFTLIEPSEDHYYQPLWTLIGAGIYKMEKSKRKMKDFIADDVHWVKDFVESFDPESNSLMTKSGLSISYDYLVVAPGIQVDWNKIEGLKDTLGRNGVCSNYSREHVEYTWEAMNHLREGRALFTFPNTPIKCAGAPQKVMYLAEETFRDNHCRDNIEVKFVSAGAGIFGIKKYKDSLEKIIKKRDIHTLFHMNLVKVDGPNKIATFKNTETGELHEEKFDMLHVSPPMSAPDFVKNSPLANEAGWVDVDKYTTQHIRYPNVFSLGDASSLPNSKTGAAIRKQAPVLVSHLVALIKHESSQAKYDGYASCPLVTSRKTCIMAEFNYEGVPTESFPFDQAKPRYSMYLMKKYGIPFIYWHGMMKGIFSTMDLINKNMSSKERALRVVIGGLITSLAFWGPENKLALIGLVPVITGLIGYCPLYSLTGLSPYKKSHA